MSPGGHFEFQISAKFHLYLAIFSPNMQIIGFIIVVVTMIINRHNSHVIINNETLAAILNFRFHGILIISNIFTQYEKNMFYYAMVIKRQMCHFSLINKPKTASWWPFWISNFSQISSILTNILTQCESKSNYVVLTILGISSCIMKPWLPSWISDFYQFLSQLTSHLYQPLCQISKESINIWNL